MLPTSPDMLGLQNSVILPLERRKYYAGIGSRETPLPVQYLMSRIACKLAQEGWTLRSGGAKGADSSFETGARCPYELGNSRHLGTVQVFRPSKIVHEWWTNASKPIWVETKTPLTESSWRLAESFAREVHPVWDSLPNWTKALLTRNTYQILGSISMAPGEIETQEIKGFVGNSIRANQSPPSTLRIQPASFVICWTPDGAVECTSRETGGTGQAIRLANLFNIPVFNLQRPEQCNRIQTWVNLLPT